MNRGKCHSGCVLNADLQNGISFLGDDKPPQQDCYIPSLQIHAFVNKALTFLTRNCIQGKESGWLVYC